jgi:hypothetical protein
LDRNIYTDNLRNSDTHPDGIRESAINQPGLELMTKKAIEVMSKKCGDGFLLMVEAAHIDKAMHAIDYDRGLADLMELDRTVKDTRQWAEMNKARGETAIIVTADHSQAYDVYGSVDTEMFNEQPDSDRNIIPDATGSQQFLQVQKRKTFGLYEDAGWPDLVTDETGMPTKWEGRYRLLSGKVDSTPHREDFQVKKKGSANPAFRRQAVRDNALSTAFNTSVAVENPAENGIIYLGSLTPGSTSTVHSLQAVDLYCYGPALFRLSCSRVMDNTELFFIMADALGLGDGSAPLELPSASTSITSPTSTAPESTGTDISVSSILFENATLSTIEGTITSTIEIPNNSESAEGWSTKGSFTSDAFLTPTSTAIEATVSSIESPGSSKFGEGSRTELFPSATVKNSQSTPTQRQIESQTIKEFARPTDVSQDFIQNEVDRNEEINKDLPLNDKKEVFPNRSQTGSESAPSIQTNTLEKGNDGSQKETGATESTSEIRPYGQVTTSFGDKTIPSFLILMALFQ